MKRTYLIFLFLFLTTTLLLSQSNPVPLINQIARVVSPSVVSSISGSQTDPKAQAKILDQYGKLPLSFEANHGQTDGRVKFLSRTNGYTLFLTGDEAVLALSGSKPDVNKAKVAGTGHAPKPGTAGPRAGGVLRMKLRNANPAAKVTGLDELAGTSNYFIGNDPKKWRTHVPTYAKVRYEGIYSGIDLVYYGNQRQLEYDFIVSPGADPRRIEFDVSGAKRIRRNGNGELVFKIGAGEIRWHKPVVYQKKNGTRQEIAARYAITDKNEVAFEVAEYDASRPLYIDPLIYSTYLGGSDLDRANAIAVDDAGNAYVAGETYSTDFPTTPGALQSVCGDVGCALSDAFVTKLNATGSALVYSTYLGGNGVDGGSGIAVDSAGDAYVTGQTDSTEFPVTPGAFQTTCNGGSNCVNAFVTKLNPTGSALLYSTYLGGSGGGFGTGIAVDDAGNAYVTGLTDSTDFPTTPGALQSVCGDVGCVAGDAFVTKLNATGSALVYSTYLGGNSSDYGTGIAVDDAGNAYVTGGTFSTDFPVTPGAFQTTCNGGSKCATYGDAFIAKLNHSGAALVYSTYLGGGLTDFGKGIVVDSAGDAYVTGETYSGKFPTASPLQGIKGVSDAFVTKLNPSGSALFYSTYLGGSGDSFGSGIAVDDAGNAYVTGITTSANFPTKNPLQPAYGGDIDAFVAKIDPLAATTTALSSSLNPSIYGQAVIFTATVTSSIGFPHDGEIVTFKQGTTVLGTGTLSDGTATFSISTLGAGTKGVTAVYGGDANFATSTSKSVSEVIAKATSTTTLTSSQNPSTFGQSITLTATVAPQFSGTPNGTMTFKNGAATLGTPVVSGGVASYTTAKFDVGTHTITAAYNGSSSFTASTSAALSQVVNQASTTTTLVSSLNPSNVGQSVTFTATVAPEFSGTPTGTMTFKNGTGTLGTVALSGGVAGYTTAKLDAGTASITATYNGATSFHGSSSAPLTQTVNGTGPYGIINPADLNFGQVVVGNTSPQETVSLANIGNSQLTVSNISISGDFAVITNYCTKGVQPATHCNVYVTFTPQGVGTESGSLIFMDNASNSPQTISLTGVGTN